MMGQPVQTVTMGQPVQTGMMAGQPVQMGMMGQQPVRTAPAPPPPKINLQQVRIWQIYTSPSKKFKYLLTIYIIHIIKIFFDKNEKFGSLIY